MAKPVEFLKACLTLDPDLLVAFEGEFATEDLGETPCPAHTGAFQRVNSESASFAVYSVDSTNRNRFASSVLERVGLAGATYHVQIKSDRYLLKAYDRFSEGCTLVDATADWVDRLLKEGILTRAEALRDDHIGWPG